MPHSHRVNDVRFVIQFSKGLIRSQRVRRTLMFYNVLLLLGLIFGGATFLWGWLREHVLIFVIYWAACAWLTLLAFLLALYDMAKVRQDARRERQKLVNEYFKEAPPGSDDDSHPSR